MSARALALGAVAVAAAVAIAGTATRMTSASFTTSLDTPGNAVTVDRLSNHFSVTPGDAATGTVDTLSIDLGPVDAPRTISDVFTVTNVSGATRTAALTLDGPAQVAAATFASSGAATATLAPGASSSVSVTMSPSVAGTGTGTLRLGLAGSGWLYRDYSLRLDAAPAAPTGVTATPRPAADIEVSWTSATTTNLAGFDVYRSTGGGWTKRNTSLVTGTSWLDTSSTNGTQYSYRVRAVSTDDLQSLDSATASALADSTAPTRPSAVALANGGGAGNAFLNSANSGSVSVRVTLPSASVATDTVTVTLSRNGVTASGTAPATAGAGTVTVTGIDATALADGSVTISATASDAAGNTSSARTTTATKDTVAPNAPTATYDDRSGGQADRITGTCQAGATITATRTVPSAAGPYTTTASNGGSYTVTVAAQSGSVSSPVTVTYLVTATDAAGNTGAATTLTYDVTR